MAAAAVRQFAPTALAVVQIFPFRILKLAEFALAVQFCHLPRRQRKAVIFRIMVHFAALFHSVAQFRRLF